jgi:hypothetical protein
MSIVQVTVVPKKSVAKIEFREADTKVDTVFEWLKDNSRSNIWWTVAQFRDRATSRTVVHNRQRHFKDGYYVYTFFFASKKDAALFTLIFGSVR